MKIKRIIGFILVLAMLFALVGCSKDEPVQPNVPTEPSNAFEPQPDDQPTEPEAVVPNGDVGMYIIDHYEVQGTTVGRDIIEGAGMGDYYVELKDDGTGAICPLMEAMEMTWSDGVIKTTMGLTLPYTIEGDAISVDFSGTILTYVRSGEGENQAEVVPPVTDQPIEPVEPEVSEPPTVSEPPESAAPAGLHPGEPSSSGDGMLADMTALYRLTKWLRNMDSTYKKENATYEFVVAYAGAEGLDHGNKGPNSVNELGDHYFFWKADDYYYINVGFRPNKDGKWVVANFHTNGFKFDDIPDDIEVSYETIVPEGVDAGATITDSFNMECFMTDIMTELKYTIPAYGWVVKPTSYELRLTNVPTLDDVWSNSPCINIGTQSTLERINFYQENFENEKEIESRTIGGVEMKGRTYKNVGMQWTEYYGQLPSGIYIYIKISGVDISSGSQGDAILNSLSFN